MPRKTRSLNTANDQELLGRDRNKGSFTCKTKRWGKNGWNCLAKSGAEGNDGCDRDE